MVTLRRDKHVAASSIASSTSRRPRIKDFRGREETGPSIKAGNYSMGLNGAGGVA
jgi:ribosomal protein L5